MSEFLARGRADREAIRDASGAWTYGDLAARVEAVAGRLGPLEGARVGLLLERSKEAVAAFLGVLQAGGVALPFSTRATPREIAYAVGDAGISRLVTDRALENPAPGAATVPLARLLEPGAPRVRASFAADAPAAILYTSGTTGSPKGVVHTHASLVSQVDILHRAWEWSESDALLHVLPLHHVHGLVNGLLGALWSGARVLLAAFDAGRVWEAFAAGEATVFYAVPTLYHQLVEAWGRDRPGAWTAGAAGLRLAVAGSAALPAPLFHRWREIAGQALLERYGMTEIGMALSNPYRGERRAGTVGQPLPGMEVRIDEGSGEILVRGPSLFKEYWGKPEATRESFEDGWFRTGDVAAVEDGYYRILGRASQDIIKSAGYKLSALEIEAVLVEHPAIAEVAVVGLPDPEWGEVATAFVVLRPGASLTLEALRSWGGDKLSPYKQPRRLEIRPSLPRTAVGKVQKKALLP
jgi:malonyl-CoA/methylmalonyl-CoA synthetase